MKKIKTIVLLVLFFIGYLFAFFKWPIYLISVISFSIFLFLIFLPYGGNIINSTINFKNNMKINKIKNEENFFPEVEGTKIALMMSGGVDSSVSLKLLLDKGYYVEGFYMRNWDSTANFEMNKILSKDEICEQEKDFEDAKKVAEHFNIKLNRIDFVKEYWDNVFEDFIKGLKKGITPNPDILCNKNIKFGKFIEYINSNFKDFNYIASGHYAKIVERDGVKLLCQSKDKVKDQTYFLSEIDKKVLDKIIFPLADLNKEEVRKIASEANIFVANKKDSTGICFIGKRNFLDFLSNYIDKKEGNIIDQETGQKVGKHKGAIFYTIGQRKGLNLGGFDKPYFVSGKDIQKNIIFVSSSDYDKFLYKNKVFSKDFNFLVSKDLVRDNMKIEFKIRHSEIIYKGKLLLLDNNIIEVNSNKRIKAITPGQELVLYYNGICLGGGQIIDYENL